MRTTAIDTMILAWALFDRFPNLMPGQVVRADEREIEMRERSTALMSRLKAEKVAIALPSPVVGELLRKVPTKHHDAALAIIDRSFRCPPYDVRAAALAARIWQERLRDGVIDTLRADEITRTRLKADVQVLAVAITAGADLLYTEDVGLQRLAQGKIPVTGLPRAEGQRPLDYDPRPRR